jgi:hypothetical protein
MEDIATLTSLSVDELIQVKVRAHNADDWGEYSEINTSGASIESTPLEMGLASYDSSMTTNTQIKLTWTELSGTNAGGSEVVITDYIIEYSTDLTTWTTLPSVLSGVGYLIFDNTYYPSIAGGQTFYFKIRAENKYGEGEAQTSYTTVKTGQAPNVPSAPTTSVPSNSVYVMISWTLPTTNSFDITKYQI